MMLWLFAVMPHTPVLTLTFIGENFKICSLGENAFLFGFIQIAHVK